jgi:hypothetical protein
VPDSIKAEVELKAARLIEEVIKPKHVGPPPAKPMFNYLTDITSKWYRSYFYFISTYACPGPTAISPSFEAKFARMKYVGQGKFSLCFMRHTDEWAGMYDQLSVDEWIKLIRDDPWFEP